MVYIPVAPSLLTNEYLRDNIEDTKRIGGVSAQISEAKELRHAPLCL